MKQDINSNLEIDETIEIITRIVDGEVWAGWVQCSFCDHEWVDCAPWNTEIFECPECGELDGRKKFNCGEEAAGRIATALVDILKMPAVSALSLMTGPILSAVSNENGLRRQFEAALKFLAMEEAPNDHR